MPKRKKRKVIRCKVCKKRFRKIHKRIYCSEECVHEGRLIRKRRYYKESWKKNNPTLWEQKLRRLCARPDCGWYFRAKNKTIYCSERCRFIAKRRSAYERNKRRYRTDPEHRAKVQELLERYESRKHVSTPKVRAANRKKNRKHIEKNKYGKEEIR